MSKATLRYFAALEWPKNSFLTCIDYTAYTYLRSTFKIFSLIGNRHELMVKQQGSSI